MSTDDIIAEVTRLDLQPGDYALLRLGQDLNTEQLDYLRTALKQALPDNKAIILGPGATLEKLSDEERRWICEGARA